MKHHHIKVISSEVIDGFYVIHTETRIYQSVKTYEEQDQLLEQFLKIIGTTIRNLEQKT